MCKRSYANSCVSLVTCALMRHRKKNKTRRGVNTCVSNSYTEREWNMSQTFENILDKAKNYCLTHDDIEIFLFVCCWGFLGWMMFHAFNGIMERIYC